MTMPDPIPAPNGLVRAAALDGGEWLQGGPVSIGAGKPVMVEFWDYTCVNCLRTQPYLAEWHRRYASLGLTIVGVHTPEFPFARNPDNVRAAMSTLDIPYPVILDADYTIWQAYNNQYWPAKYFIDGAGLIRAQHYGEGAYFEAETFIQTLLREQPGFSADLPALVVPMRPEDAPGAVCYRVTPEVYCGYDHATIGNVGVIAPDRTQTYTDPGRHVEGALYLDGPWVLASGHVARPFGAQGPSRLRVTYTGADVNAVLHPPLAGGAASIRVLLDGAPLPPEHAAADAPDGVITVDQPRMYRIVRDGDVNRHTLELETAADGLAAFSFTFTSCVAPVTGVSA